MKYTQLNINYSSLLIIYILSFCLSVAQAAPLIRNTSTYSSAALGSQFDLKTEMETPAFTLSFNGNDPESFVDCGSSSAFSPEQFAIEAWVYPENRTGNYILANEAHDDISGPQGYVLRMTSEGYPEFAMGAGGNWEQITATGTTVPLNEWTHIAVTFDTEKVLRIYINGIEVSSKTSGSELTPTNQNLYMGESPSWQGRRFTGRMYDIRVWEIARTGEEILSTMSNFPSGTEPGLIASWRLNEGTGNEIQDHAGSNTAIRGTGTYWSRFASLISDQKKYLLDQEKDSVTIFASGTEITSWTVLNSASAGNVYISGQSPDSCVLVYEPSSEEYFRDSIAVQATSDNLDQFNTYILFEIYPDRYHLEGEVLLDRILSDFYNPTNGLYAENITASGVPIQRTSYLWPASHLLRAMKFAYRVNPGKYIEPLKNYIVALDQYIYTRDGTTGYSAFPAPGDTRFYDDNGLLIIQFADIAKDDLNVDLISRAKIAYNFNNSIRDAYWGIPQHENQLGSGMFYSMAVNQTGLGAAMLHNLTENQSYLNQSINYYQQLNNPDVLIKDPQYKLFHQYTFSKNGTWSFEGTIDGTYYNGRGFRAYQTSHVFQQGILLYEITGQREYLDDAIEMAQACRSHFYTPNRGLNENAFWGGNDLIDAFLDLFLVTGDSLWQSTCFDIMDFIIEKGKDKAGYYPGDYNDAYGKWNLDRTNVEPSEILMMGQAAAASALLHVAYFKNNPDIQIPSSFSEPIYQTARIWPTALRSGSPLNVMIDAENNQTSFSIDIYTVNGRKIKGFQIQNSHGSGPVQIGSEDLQPGIYILKIMDGRSMSTAKFLVY